MGQKENPDGGGTLLDLGPHVADQALVLFGKPDAVSADVVREKDGPGVNDAFTIRLRYPGVAVTVAANSLSLPPAPRFHLRGSKGGFVKNGVEPRTKLGELVLAFRRRRETSREGALDRGKYHCPF